MLKELLVELVDKPIVVDENPLIYRRKLMNRMYVKEVQEKARLSREREIAGEVLSDEEVKTSVEHELAILDVLRS